jgi:glutathione S-transferase
VIVMSELQILGAPASNYVWVVRMACAEKGVPYTLIPLFPHTPEIGAIHPFGKIPVMRHGVATLCESRAICLYVERTFDGPRLVPQDALGAARVEQWISIINTHIAPVCVSRYLLGYFFPDTPDGAPDRALIDGALPEMRQQFAVLDDAVGATGYLAGDAFTLADIALLPTLHYLHKLPESGALLAQMQRLARYYDRHSRRPSFMQTLPETMPPSIERALASAQAA